MFQLNKLVTMAVYLQAYYRKVLPDQLYRNKKNANSAITIEKADILRRHSF